LVRWPGRFRIARLADRARFDVDVADGRAERRDPAEPHARPRGGWFAGPLGLPRADARQYAARSWLPRSVVDEPRTRRGRRAVRPLPSARRDGAAPRRSHDARRAQLVARAPDNLG